MSRTVQPQTQSAWKFRILYRVEKNSLRREACKADLPSKSSSQRSITIDAGLKAWLDNVLVPALVQQYLAKARGDEDNGSIPMERAR